MLEELGFHVVGEFSICKGPKAKLDIIECWHVYCLDRESKQVLIGSCHTMTELCRTGIVLAPESAYSQIYGDFLAEPKPKGKTLA